MRWTKWMHAVLNISIQLSQGLRRGFQIRSREFVVNEWSGRMPRVWMRGDQTFRVTRPVGWCFFSETFNFQKSVCWFLASIFWCLFFLYRSKNRVFGDWFDISTYCHYHRPVVWRRFPGKGATHPKHHSDAQQEDGLRFGVSRQCSKGKNAELWKWCFCWRDVSFLRHEWKPFIMLRLLSTAFYDLMIAMDLFRLFVGS